MSIFNKVIQASEAYLDSYIEKAKTTTAKEDQGMERKSVVELDFAANEQYGWKEKSSMVGPGVLKNMARKDSIITSIINTRIAQAEPFCKPQKDRYSSGWKVVSKVPVDISEEDKLKLANPELSEEEKTALHFELEKKRAKLKAEEAEDLAKIEKFILHCGMPAEETDTSYKRWDFDKFVKAVIWDRLVYNYGAVELVPTRSGDKLHHFYPVSAGTIKYVSERSAEMQLKNLSQFMDEGSRAEKHFDKKKPFRYVQVVRGKIVAAFTEDDLIFEPATPTVDPDDNGYSPGELELLLQVVTAHLYAEAHNRNFFTQGIGTKGILHIKGDNISRGQLEGFKRQWFSQLTNSRNAFRPPIIGMADEVKWVSLAQSNREMEFEQWMHYLIRVACAIYQIDPAEINFDISKGNSSALQESSNEEKLKNSRDKGLQPLLNYIENMINRHILRYWDKELADKYEFKFVGFNAESREQEMKRLETETKVWKTLNEARVEMGAGPLPNGDIVLNATFTQYLAQKEAKDTAEQAMQDQAGEQNSEAPGAGETPPEGQEDDLNALADDLVNTISETQPEAPAEEAKKSKVEYYFDDEE